MAHLAHDPDARPDGRSANDLKAVMPLTAELRDGELYVGGVSTVELAREFGTALYVYDEEHIRERLATWLRELRAVLPQADVAYAGKAFTCKAMVRLLAEAGAHLDVSSGGELAIALAAGFPAERVVVHGNNKSERELTEAIEAGAGLIVVDCFEELERVNRLAGGRGVVQPILLRIKPGVVADTHEYIRTGAEDSKFGFGLSDGAALQAVEQALALPHCDLRGLHAHIGSQIYALESFAETLRVLAAFLAELRASTGFVARDLNLGGGVGIAYLADDEPPQIAQFAAIVAETLKAACREHDLPLPRLLVEPGRSIVAGAGLTLYTVGSIKKLLDLRTYVAVDGGMTDNIRVALYGARYESVIASRADAPRDALVTLAGKHCESGDVVAIDASLQSPRVGDVICMFATGAYGHSMASNYNRQVRPGVVFVRDGRAREVLRRETYADLLNCETD
ncbi:MAG: diaminopimelate decarboxylase [Coriobacteriales bacterium]|jgi:diaminopimelate decarboxylase|nr:diaminopimelate decarboxylase [Coriobacteriales bacterium]